MGNIVGSNIFNIFFILGTSAVIYPVTIASTALVDMLMNVFLSLLIFFFIFTGKGHKLDKWEGLLLVFLYAIYLGFLIFS